MSNKNNTSDVEEGYGSEDSSLFGERYEKYQDLSEEEDLKDSNDSFEGLFNKEKSYIRYEYNPGGDTYSGWKEDVSDSESFDPSYGGFYECEPSNDNPLGSGISSSPSEFKFNVSEGQEHSSSFGWSEEAVEVEKVSYFLNGFEFFNFEDFVFYSRCAMDTSSGQGYQNSHQDPFNEALNIANEELSYEVDETDDGWQYMDTDQEYSDWPLMDTSC